MQNEFTVIHEPVSLDNGELLSSYLKLGKEVSIKKAMLDLNIHASNEHDYLKVALSRLAYGFAKEEYTKLCTEVRARGLITE